MGTKSAVTFLLTLLLLAIVTILLLGFSNVLLASDRFPQLFDPNTDENLLTCAKGKTVLPENAVVYKPSLLAPKETQREYELQKEELRATITATSRRFHTVIIDCPYNRDTNYTEPELQLVEIFGKARADAEKRNDTLLNIWLGMPDLETGNGSACLELVKAANQIQPGTIEGLVMSDESILEFAEISSLMGEILTTTSKRWQLLEDLTFDTWNSLGLKAGLLVSSVYCLEFEAQIPNPFLLRFNQTFYLEEKPSRFKVVNGTPLLGLSEEYKSCQKQLENRFSLKVVVGEKYIAKGANLHPYCLL